MANVELSVDANLQGLRQQLQSIPGLTAEQARLMTAELNKSIRASEKAAKQAADASKRAMEQAAAGASRAAGAVDNLGDRFGKVGSNSAKLAGALGMVNPGLADMARNVADLADVGEVGASLSGLGLAIGGVTAVAGLFLAGLAPIAELLADERQRAEEATAAIEAYTVAHEDAANAAGALASTMRSVSDEIKLKTGLETADDQAVRKKTEALFAEVTALEQKYGAETAAAEAVVAANSAELKSLEVKIKWGSATAEQVARYRELVGIVGEATGTIAANNKTVAQARAVATEQAEALALIAEAEKKARAAEEARRKAAERAAKAAAAKAEADRQAAAAIKASEDAVREAEAEYEAMNKRMADAQAHHEAIAKAINDQHVAALDTLTGRLQALVPSEPMTELQQLELLIADIDLAMTRAPTEELGMRFAAMSDQATAALQKLKTEASDAFDYQEAADYFASIKSGADGLFADLSEVTDYYEGVAQTNLKNAISQRKSLGKDATDEEREQAKQQVKDARDAARKQFEITKALQVAQIIINTAAAATQALAASPPPFNFVAAAAATAAGAVQLATVSSTQPKFHKGGLIGQPDESMAVVRAGEAVLNPMGRKALGDEAIRAANAGALDHGGGAVQVVYKHKSFDYFVRDHLRTNATLPRALNAGRRLGHRGG